MLIYFLIVFCNIFSMVLMLYGENFIFFELQLALMEWLSSPNRISITFWLDDEVVKAWYELQHRHHGGDLSAILISPSPLFW